jgi:glycosyltransferase involved in cell wall biosynthesis
VSDRLKVLHLGKYYPPDVGGIESHVRELATGLAREIDVEVVVAARSRSTAIEVLDGVKVRRLRQVAMIASAPVTPGLRSAIASSDSDIVHLHHPNPLATLALLSTRRRPLVISWHGDAVRQQLLGKAMLPFLSAALRRAAAVIVATPRHITSSPILPRFSNRCHVIPYGVDPDELAAYDHAEAAALRERYGSFVLAVGRCVYYKGFDVLLRAMRKIDAPLVLVGSGPELPRLRETARRIGISHRAHFLERVADVRPFYAACSLFVLPSVARSEAFGIVQLEAMANRKPVINTALDSGVPEVSLDGVTGLTVPVGDDVSLARAMDTLLSDEKLREEFGSAGQRRVEEYFTTAAMVRKTLTLYRSLL